MNFSPFIPCFFDHLLSVSDFCQLSCRYILLFSHSFSSAAFASGMFNAWDIRINLCRLWSSSSSPAHWHGCETHAAAITFPPESGFFVEPSTGPSASRNTFSVSTITDGYARAREPQLSLPLRRPDCTSSRLVAFSAEENDRPVTQSIATPEPSSRTIPTLDRAETRWSLECVTTHGSWRSCPGWASAHLTWILTVFTSLPGTWAHSRISEDCHRRTTWRPLTVAGSPVLPPCATHWRFLPRRHGTTAGPACATRVTKVFAHTQVRDPRGPAAACFGHALGTSSPGDHIMSGLPIRARCKHVKTILWAYIGQFSPDSSCCFLKLWSSKQGFETLHNCSVASPSYNEESWSGVEEDPSDSPLRFPCSSHRSGLSPIKEDVLRT